MAGKISQILAGIPVSAVRHQNMAHIVDVLGEVGARLADLPVPVQHLPLIPVGDGGAVESSLLATESMLSVTPSGKNGGGGPTSGSDTLTGTSNNDTIHGLAGDDIISGLGGNDALYGDDGNDAVAGGPGADTIDGGIGDDILYSDVQSPLIGSGGTVVLDRGTEVDTLTGGDGNDTISAGYGDNVDGGANDYAGDKLYISFQGATGGVHFDGHLATQTIGGGTITGIENISWVEGSNYDDYLDAGTGLESGYADLGQVHGMGGNDTLIAGYYTSLLDGGDGNDIVDGRNSAYLSEADGGAGDDTIYANGGGLSVGNGGDGNDIIYAGWQAHGGAGNDTIYLTYSGYGHTVTGDGGDDVIIGQSIYGGYDNIQGNDGNDTIRGGGSDDVIDGGAGMDSLSGGIGTDTLTGGADNDIFLFQEGDGKDTITDFTSGDTIQINGYTSAQSITQNGTDVVVTFSSGDQITLQSTTVTTVQAGLQFLPPTDDTLVGGTGDDLLRGFGGHDTISGGDGNDILAGGAGPDTIDGGAGDDTIYSGDISVPWNAPYYNIAYNPPTLDTGNEADTITGGDGSDRIFAGFGDNVDGGADGYWGDKLFISFQGAPSGIHFDGHLDTQSIGGGTITGIEDFSWVQGSNYDDYIDVGRTTDNGYSDFTVVQGMGGNDTLIAGFQTGSIDGGDGNDTIDGRPSAYIMTIDGGAGDDTIYAPGNGSVITNGGDGNDTISAAAETHGGAGDDIITMGTPYFGSTTVTGDAGNDTIVDGDGADVVDGGAGNDVLTGGAGNDTFVVGIGNDTVTDLSAGEKLHIEASFSGDAMAQVGNDVVITFANHDTLTVKNSDIAAVTASLRANMDDMAMSADGSTIYEAGEDGTLYVFSAETGSLLNAWHVGKELGGVDISPDGTFAMVTDLQPLTSYYAPDNYWPDNQFTIAVYKVDLSTGDVTSYPLAVTGNSSAFWDVAVLANGSALVSEQSGGNFILDPSTGTYTPQNFGGNVSAMAISASADGKYALMGMLGISDGPLFIYGSGQGLLASHTLYKDGGSGFNSGLQAMTEDGQLVAQYVYGNGLNIYDSQLHLTADLTTLHPEWSYGRVSGLAFDHSGQYLFVLDNETDSIVQLSTADWSVVATYAVGADVPAWGYGDDIGFGDSLIVAPDMSYFTVMTADGWVEVLPPVAAATAGPDTISGTVQADTINGLGGNDVIHGLGGNDTLDGGAGNDTLDGGNGTDTASYASASAGVTVSLAVTVAQNTIGAGTDTLTGIENLVGSNYADTLTGDGAANSLSGGGGADTLDGAGGADTLDGGVGADILIGGGSNDSLVGGGGNDVLKGGAGNDAMTGGIGSDTYYVDSLGDTTVENAGEGQDLVVSSIGWTLGANLENLTLTGTASIDGTGNDLVNTIVGNSGDNHLNGLGGNDTLNGAAGNDTLDGGLANDSLSGGDGNDTLLGGQGTDTLNGGVGSDWLEGGAARDILTGGTGADQFVFRDGDFGNSQATADKITDFSSVDGDKINLQFVDANTLLSGDQGFSFIGTSAFDGHTAGQLRYEQINGFTFVEGDMDGDGHADMMIRLTGPHTLTGGDFVL
jgi:Ca2+-binding RTX toxin-like protein